MKRLYLTLILIPLFYLIFGFVNKTTITDKVELPIEEHIEYLDEIEVLERLERYELIQALIEVESNGRVNALGDLHLGEPSIGVLQIRKVMVDDINRILKMKKSKLRYTYDDRYDKYKSVEMFYIYVDHYHKGVNDFEVLARSWNGGPYGYNKPSTLQYWTKVSNELEAVE